MAYHKVPNRKDSDAAFGVRHATADEILQVLSGCGVAHTVSDDTFNYPSVVFLDNVSVEDMLKVEKILLDAGFEVS